MDSHREANAAEDRRRAVQVREARRLRSISHPAKHSTYPAKLSAWPPPHGIEVETDDGNINLSDLGPAPYWEESGLVFPKAGDQIQATGYVVEIDGTDRYIPTAITIDGETLELRDSETGKPLWRMPPPRFEDNNE